MAARPFAEVDRQALEAQLEEMQGYCESAQYIAVARSIGMDEETSSEYYAQRSRYLDGTITLDEFIRNIDQKPQMIVLEGR